jgi:hypothetical protein
VGAGCGLFVVAATMIPIGMVEDGWPDRATVWATALAAAALGAQVLASAAADRPDEWAAFVGPIMDGLGAPSTWLGTVCLVLLFVMADVPDDGILAATGDLELLTDATGRVSIIVPLRDGGIASCSHDDGSANEWSSPQMGSEWGDPGRSSAFFSARGAVHILDQRGGGLVQGRQEREGDLAWYGEYPVMSQEVPTARGRPAFFEHLDPNSQYWYLALVPDTAGGVRLYWRNVQWGRTGPIHASIGLVDSVTAVDVFDDGVKAILRVDDRLLWTTKPPEAVRGDFNQRWSRPQELRTTAGDAVRVTGDPAMIRTPAVGAAPQRYRIAVPTVDGLHLLTAADFESNRWTVEPLPMTRQVESVALVEMTIDGQPSLLVAYRVGPITYATFTRNHQWHQPEPVRCRGRP